jgi:hypothetical protein
MGATMRLAEMALEETRRPSRTASWRPLRATSGLPARSVHPNSRARSSAAAPSPHRPRDARYFMLIPEAVSLVSWLRPWAGRRLLVLDMGEPVRIVELDVMLISLTAVSPTATSRSFSPASAPEKNSSKSSSTTPTGLPHAHDRSYKSRLDRDRQAPPAQLTQAFAEGSRRRRPGTFARFVPYSRTAGLIAAGRKETVALSGTSAGPLAMAGLAERLGFPERAKRAFAYLWPRGDSSSWGGARSSRLAFLCGAARQPVLFRQQPALPPGLSFMMYNFRTMTTPRRPGRLIPEENGSPLRALSASDELDELPELLKARLRRDEPRRPRPLLMATSTANPPARRDVTRSSRASPDGPGHGRNALSWRRSSTSRR